MESRSWPDCEGAVTWGQIGRNGFDVQGKEKKDSRAEMLDLLELSSPGRSRPPASLRRGPEIPGSSSLARAPWRPWPLHGPTLAPSSVPAAGQQAKSCLHTRGSRVPGPRRRAPCPDPRLRPWRASPPLRRPPMAGGGDGKAGRKVPGQEERGSSRSGVPRPRRGREHRWGAEGTRSPNPCPGAPRPESPAKLPTPPNGPKFAAPAPLPPCRAYLAVGRPRSRRAAARVPGRRPRCARPSAALCLRRSLLPPPGGRCRPGRTPPARAPRASQPPSPPLRRPPARPRGSGLTIPAAAAAAAAAAATLPRRSAPASSALFLLLPRSSPAAP
uniref:basic proline-rich protein-like n=1 Tax=Callithrix jacchus TaxID=9483 RepID=UPI0023DD0C9B|nr:basic proline-rich protein-like [Callithrix jacchus]